MCWWLLIRKDKALAVTGQAAGEPGRFFLTFPVASEAQCLSRALGAWKDCGSSSSLSPAAGTSGEEGFQKLSPGGQSLPFLFLFCF